MAGKIFVFFNCDAEKSQASMNIFYNNAAYKDTPISRRRLLRKIQDEKKAGRVQFADADLSKIEAAIISGNPADASNFLTYGAVKDFDCL